MHLALTFYRMLFPDSTVTTRDDSFYITFLLVRETQNSEPRIAVSFLSTGDDVPSSPVLSTVLTQKKNELYALEKGRENSETQIISSLLLQSTELAKWVRDRGLTYSDFIGLSSRTWPAGEALGLVRSAHNRIAEQPSHGTCPALEELLPQELLEFLSENAHCLPGTPAEFVVCRDCTGEPHCGTYNRETKQLTICTNCGPPYTAMLVHELTHLFDFSECGIDAPSCTHPIASPNPPDKAICECSLETEFHAYYCGGYCGTVRSCCKQAWRSSAFKCLLTLSEGITRDEFVQWCMKKFSDLPTNCPFGLLGRECSNKTCQSSQSFAPPAGFECDIAAHCWEGGHSPEVAPADTDVVLKSLQVAN